MSDGDTGTVMIPQADPARRLRLFRREIEEAFARVLDSGHLLLAAETAGLEAELGLYLGVPHVVATASGAAALTIALSALGIGAGDEVILPALTAVPTAGAVRHAGATPVFADVDPVTRNLDVGSVEAAIGPRTAAIVPVHLHGMPADMAALVGLAARHGLRLIEDCAQALGARCDNRLVGTFGDAATFSFYPTKNLGAAGDAGALVISDAEVAARARRIRSQGLDGSGLAVDLGQTGRIDEIQAAILRVLLPHLDAANAERRRLADAYRSLLCGLDVGPPPDHAGMIYHQFAILVDDRDAVKARMAANGVLTGVHYPYALHRHPVFARADLRLPVAEHLCARLLSLPIQPEVLSGRVEQVVAVLRRSLTT